MAILLFAVVEIVENQTLLTEFHSSSLQIKQYCATMFMHFSTKYFTIMLEFRIWPLHILRLMR